MLGTDAYHFNVLSLINSVRLLYNDNFDSLSAVDNVVVVNETGRLCRILASEIIL